MCKYIYTLLLVFLSARLSAQTPAWAFNLGCSTTYTGKTCKVCPNGNVCIAGRFDGTMDLDPGPGVYNITSHGLDDIYLACYTSNGAFLWGFGIGGPSYDAAFGMTIDANNNVIICGYFQSAGVDFDPGTGTTILPYVGGTGLAYYGDGFVAKYSSTGVFQWAQDLGGVSVYDHTESLGTDPAGNVYVGGEFDITMTVSTLTFNSGTDGQAYLLKYSPTGTLIWGHNFGLPGTASSDCVPFALQVSNGYIYCAGFFQATSNFDPWGAPAILTTVGYYDAFIAKYDINGNYVFAYPVSGSGFIEQLFGLVLDASDNIYITGMTNSASMTFNPSSPATSTVAAPGGGGTNHDIVLAKYDKNGVYQWGTLLGGPGEDYGWGLDIANGYLYCTGYFSGTVDMDPSPAVSNLVSNGGTDVYLTKYDLNGNYMCGFNIGSAGTDDYGFGVSHDASGSIYLTGQFGGTAVDFDPGPAAYPLTALTSLDAFLVKYNYIGPSTFTGSLAGGTICLGDSAHLTLTVTSGGTGPYTITYSNGTTTQTLTGVNSGTPFAVIPTPTVTTTYSITTITPSGSGSCTLSSGTGFGTATIVVTSCAGCDSLSMPDSLHLCIHDTITMPATVTGSNTILSMAWTPATGLSSTTLLHPLLTATTSGWYDLTIQSLIPNNLVVNGDFSAGNTGFTSSYIYSPPPSSILNEGYYSVYTNPNGVHTGFNSFGDHTTGTGNMMIINGGFAATSLWCETIPVVPNTDYDFSAWFANCSAVSTGANVPILQFMVNGVLLGTPTTVSAAPTVWVNFFSTWNSGSNTSATICIYDEVTTASGNDFVIDDISFEQICKVKDSVYVKINIPDTTYHNTDTAICSSVGSITLHAPPGYGSYLWNTGSTAASLSVSTAGTFWDYANGTCGTRIDSFHVSIKPTPPPPHTKDTFYCQNYGFPLPLSTQVDTPTGTLQWYLSGMHLSSMPAVTTTTPNYPVGTIWYVSQVVGGCESDSAAVSVAIIPPPNSIIASQSWVCQYDSISLTYTPTGIDPLPGSFAWTIPPGSVLAGGTQLTDSSIIVRFDSVSGNNYVYLASTYLAGECSVNDTTRIDVIAIPNAIAYSKPDVCLGDTVSLALSYRSANAIDFTWLVDNSALSVSGAVNIIAANSNSGGPFSISWADTGIHIIHVTAFAEHGCTGPPTADTVDVHTPPDASFSYTTTGSTLCLEDSVLFSANSDNYRNTYSWAPAHFFNGPDKPTIWGKVELQQSIVTLTVTDPFGCSASTTQELDPNSCCTIIMPNAFTPNGDGRNDVYRPIFTGYHNFHVFRIDNRWGQTVFETTTSLGAWDGTFNGVPQDMGVYFYYIKYDCGGKTIEQKGDCTLIR